MVTFVYWIFDETCVDIQNSGYVGVTHDVVQRFKRHIKNGRVPANSSFRIMFEGSREECFAFEHHLRPTKRTGWNNAVGGAHGWRIGFSHSQETINKMLDAWTEERKAKAAVFKAKHNKLLTGQKRPKQSIAMSGSKNPMFGTKRPPHVIEAIKRAHIGKPSKNRQEIYCAGCHQRVNKTFLKKYHNKCFKLFLKHFDLVV